MLPNLPKLAGDWSTVPITVATNPGVWTPVLPADPTRWAVLFTTGDVGAALVWPVGDAGVNDGLYVALGVNVTLYYKDFGPLVQSEWFCLDTGGKGSISILTAAIRKLQPQQLIPPEATANVP